MKLVNAYLSGSQIVLLSRDDSGTLNRKTVPAEYIVYLDSTEMGDDFARDLAKSRFVRSLKREGKWIRVGWSDKFIRDEMLFGKRGSDPRPSPFEERGIRTYEGDVHPVRRYLTDVGVQVQKPRRAYFDLETDSRVPFSKKEEMRILSWAIVAEDGRKWSAVLEADDDASEHGLLVEFFKTVDEFDQLLAWNGDNFDFPVLRARVDKRALRVDPERWLWLDQLVLFKKMNTASESGDEKQSMALQSIAMALLGEGKNDFDASKTYEAWAAGGAARERLREYNVQDTDLLRRIEEKTGSASLFDTVAEVTNVFPDSRGLQTTVQMDGYLLREGLERGVHFATKKYRQGTNDQYGGAYVMQPRCSGIERDVHVCDFAAMYPSIILTWNMSPETKVDVPINGHVIPEGCCRSPSTRQGFRVEEPGILPSALKKLMGLRVVHNARKAASTPGTPEWFDADRRSTAYKVVANSFYGGIGSPYSRFFDRRIAESVTKNGEWLLKRVIEEAEKRGMIAIYGDTDSAFVKNATRTQFEEFVRWCNDDLFPRIVAETGCTENHIKLAYEKQFKRIVFTGAKRYAAIYTHYKGKEATAGSKPEIRGLEFRRGDTSLLARGLQEQVIDRMIVEGDDKPESYRGLLGELLTRVLNDPLPIEQVQISKAVTKPLKEYATKKKMDGEDASSPPHVRVAKILAARGAEVGEGTRIAYVVLDGDGGINVAIPAGDYDGTCDRYYLWENLVYPPTLRLLQAAFPDSDWTTALERVRPPKPRGRARKPVGGQLGLAVGPISDEGEQAPFILPIQESSGSDDVLLRVRDVIARHPGGRPLVLHIFLKSGAVAVLSTGLKVSGSAAFASDVEEAYWGRAASMDWEMTCAN